MRRLILPLVLLVVVFRLFQRFRQQRSEHPE